MSEVVKLNGYDIKDLKAVRTYENVQAMKSDTKLRVGQHVKTKGYYTNGDGGSAEYIIVNDNTLVDDGGSIHELTNGLRAKLINIPDKINIKLFGCYGDNTHDDTTCLQHAINYAGTNKINLFIPSGTYKHDGIAITSPVEIEGTGQSILLNIGNNPSITINHTGGQVNYIRTKLRNIILDNNDNDGIIITSGNVDIIEYVRILNSDTAINNSGNIYIDNIRIEVANIGISLNSSDNHINNVTSFNCMTHYYNNGGFNIFKNVHGWNFDDTTNNIDWTTGSIFMTVNSYQTEIINCYADTLNTIFNITQTSPYMLLNVQNLIYFINRSSYPDSKPKPIFFTSTDGKVNVNSFECDFNGYVGNGSGNVVEYPSNIRIDNFIGNGVKFGNNIYYHDDVDLTATADTSSTTHDIIITNNDYLSNAGRGLIRKNNSRYLHYNNTLKRSLPENTEIFTATLQNKLANLNNMLITCYAYTSSACYPLYAYIENNTLHIWNKGEAITSATLVVLNGILEKNY